MVYPPLPKQLLLESLQGDKNDKTGELGWWMNDKGMKDTGKFVADIEILRKESESNKNNK